MTTELLVRTTKPTATSSKQYSKYYRYRATISLLNQQSARLPLQEEKGPRPTPTPVGDIKQTENSIFDTDAVPSKINVLEDNLTAQDLFINYPLDLPNFPLAFPQLEKAQQADAELQASKHYETQQFYGYNLKVYTKRSLGQRSCRRRQTSTIHCTTTVCPRTQGTSTRVR